MPKIKKVLFVTASAENIPELSGKIAVPPAGMLSIIGYARKSFPRVEFKLRDFGAERISFEEQINIIKEENPQILGMAARTFIYPETIKLAVKVKEALPDIKVVLGGHHVSLMQSSTDYPSCFDCIVRHEGEEAFVKLMKLYEEDKKWPRLLEEHYMSEISHDYAWEVIERPEAYARLYSPFNADPMGSVVWSRGCPFECVYCSGPKLWHGSTPRVRYRTTESIVNELKFIRDHFGVKRFFVHDDTPNTNLEKLKAILQEIKAANLKMTWGLAGMRADLKLTPEWLFKCLYDAGCRYVCFGVESGDEAILKAIGRTVFLEDIERALTLAKKHGMRTAGGFSIGHVWLDSTGELDGEREHNLEKTIAYMKKLVDRRLLWSIQLSVIDPVPGSKLWDIALKNNLISEDADWGNILKYDRVRLNFKHPHLDVETVNKYYCQGYGLVSKSWKHMLFLLSTVRSVRDIIGLVRTGLFVLKHRFSYSKGG